MWSPWRRHQQLESEARYETWAPQMEAALRGGIEEALTMRGLDTQRIELPVVECRTKACEIQAVGNAMDNMKPGVDFQDNLPAMRAGNCGRRAGIKLETASSFPRRHDACVPIDLG